MNELTCNVSPHDSLVLKSKAGLELRGHDEAAVRVTDKGAACRPAPREARDSPGQSLSRLTCSQSPVSNLPGWNGSRLWRGLYKDSASQKPCARMAGVIQCGSSQIHCMA